MRFINYPFLFLEKKMAPNFLDLATTLENLGARWLLEKKVSYDWFDGKTGVKQGCCMSGFLFLLVIDWVMRRTIEGR